MKIIVSKNANLAASRALRPFILVCVLVLLPLGAAHAQEISPDGEDPGRVSKRPAQGEGQQGAVARILTGVDEGKISKERAAEMVKALNKNINQEGHANLKKMLDMYWKADPSVRGLISTRIEWYLQHLQREAANQGRTSEGVDQGRGDATESPQRSAQDGAEKGAVARILAGVDEGRISKEKAAEMVKALNKNSDQEDPDLKRMLDMYWKADPSIRGLISTRIEGYLQYKAAAQNRDSQRGSQRGSERADQVQRPADGPTPEQAQDAAKHSAEPANKDLLKIVTDVAKGKTSIEKAAETITTMYGEFGVEKGDSTIKKQLEMATEFNKSEKMHKWFTLSIEVYIEKTFIKPFPEKLEKYHKMLQK